MSLDSILYEFSSKLTGSSIDDKLDLSPSYLHILYHHVEKLLLLDPANIFKINNLLQQCGVSPISSRSFSQEEINILLDQIYSAPPLSPVDLFRAEWRYRLKGWNEPIGLVYPDEEKFGANSIYRGAVYVPLPNGTFWIHTLLTMQINYASQNGSFKVEHPLVNESTPFNEVFTSPNLQIDLNIQRVLQEGFIYDTYKRLAHALSSPRGNVVKYFQRLMTVMVSYPSNLQPCEFQFYLEKSTGNLKITLANQKIFHRYIGPVLEKFNVTTTGMKWLNKKLE